MLGQFRTKTMFSRKVCCSLRTAKCFSTEVNVISSKGQQVQIPKIAFHEYIWKNLDRWPDRRAITCFETNRSFTYHQLHKKSLSVTRFLRDSLRLNTLDTVGVVLPNIPEYPIVTLGAIQAGLKVTTCNPKYTVNEIREQLENSNSQLIFTTRELVPTVRRAVADFNRTLPIVEVTHEDGFTSGTISFREISSGEAGKPVSVDPSEIAFLPYSSGTTGLPKAVQLTHSNIVANLCQMNSPEFNFIYKDDIIPAFLPFFHIYGLMKILLQSLTQGGEVISMPKFTAENFIKMIQKHKPTIIHGVPLNVIMINNTPNITIEDLTCIKLLMSGAAPLGASDVEAFRAKTNNKITLIQGYGMTETSPVTLIQSEKMTNGIKTGGSGLLVPNTDAKIIPLDGSTVGLGPNQSGELIIRGPQVMLGYFNNPQANDEVFLESGWIKTGDIAHYDEDEHFYITDRLKELIKVKGFQVAPAELEEILRTHSAVEEVAVVGIPHSTQGEAPRAFVVPKSEKIVKSQELEEFVASKVVKYKHLVGGVTFVDAIPKSPSGKILRRELRLLSKE